MAANSDRTSAIPPSTLKKGAKLSAQEQRAVECLENAEKAKNKWTFFSSDSKYEEAGDHYEKAANLFRVSKNYVEAGRAFMNAAEMKIQTKSMHEAAILYTKAANVFRKTNPRASIQCLETAIGFLTDAGRFSLAAKHQQEIAELYEGEMELAEAIDAYETAAEFFEGENSKSAASKCLKKVALFSAQLEQYGRAIEIFEELGIAALQNNLLKWGARTYFMHAGMCHLASGDVVGAQRGLQKYQDADPTFSGQRECKFLQEIVQAATDMDVEAFTNVVVEYDRMTKLDSWTTTILLRIKNSIHEDEGLEEPSAPVGHAGLDLDDDLS